jgi:hypothetical protein
MKIKTDKTKTKEKPQKFVGRFRVDGGLEFGEYTKWNLKKFIKENPNMPFELKPIFAESSHQRGWFEGALVPLVTFYQEGMDYQNSNDNKKVREWLKIEFNGQLIEVGGKVHKVAQTTSQKLNLGFLERVTDWLETNYAPPQEALNPKAYKHWHDAIFPNGGPDTYIGYLLERKILK